MNKLKRVRMSILEVGDTDKENCITEMKNSNSFMAFYTDAKGVCKFFVKGLSEHFFQGLHANSFLQRTDFVRQPYVRRKIII